jgi:hypothetical protein
LQDILNAAIERVKQDLMNPDCAKDYKNASKSAGKINGSTFGNLGLLAFSGPDSVGGPFGQYDGKITLNTAVNWLDPAHTIGLQNGTLYSYNALSATASTLGVTSLTANQLIDQVLLHEVAHYNSTIGDPDNAAVNKQIFEDCVKK